MRRWTRRGTHWRCTLGAADEQNRMQFGRLTETVQEITGEGIELAYVDQGYAGEDAAQSTGRHGV